MNLVDFLRKATALWANVFPQKRSFHRTLALACGILCGVGKRTITRAISFHGNTQKDWSADDKVFSRCHWEPRDLFHPIFQQAIQEHPLQRIVLSVDDTRVWRNGKHVPETQWHRDPLGPPFATHLRWGHRLLQASLVLPLYEQDPESSSRSIPVRFEMAPVVKKPGKKAEPAPWEEYRRLKKEKNLSVQFVSMAKELTKVYWQGGAKKRPVRLLIVSPVGYRTSKNGRQYYRQPAYLLTTDLTTPAAVLLQDYFDRWGIEVNHRDEKEILGVGEAQVWNEKSVCKVPALLVAMYSGLLLAGLACYGTRRTNDYAALPKWRRHARRPSSLDLVTLLRQQMAEKPMEFVTGSTPPTYQMMVGCAAA